jgi:hypothetical protein
VEVGLDLKQEVMGFEGKVILNKYNNEQNIHPCHFLKECQFLTFHDLLLHWMEF